MVKSAVLEAVSVGESSNLSMGTKIINYFVFKLVYAFHPLNILKLYLFI